MKMKVLAKEKDRLVFVAEGLHEAAANTLRRLIMSSVPTLAIDEVAMERNSSALYDEALAHRLGLVPLVTDLKSYKEKEKCACKGKGCAQCTLTLTLKAKGPGSVYASSLESKDPKVKAVYENMLIVKLVKDQEIKLSATAVLGRGEQHMKFSPGLVYYKGCPIIAIEKKSGIKKCIDASSNNLAEKGDHLIVKDILKWNEAMEEVCEKNGMKVDASKEDFVFFVESWGQLAPKEMVAKAVELFDDKLDECEKLVKAI